MINRIKNVIESNKSIKEFRKNKGKIYSKRWLFSSTDNNMYNYNSKYLFEYVNKNLKDVEAFYVINDSEKREELSREYPDFRFIETVSPAGRELALSCRVWFTSAGLPLYSGSVGQDHIIINLWHGVPLKKIALMDKNLSLPTRLMFKKFFTNNYSYIFTTSESLVNVMAESFAIEKDRIKIAGQPRCDVLFNKVDHNYLRELYKAKGLTLPEFDKAILYAPTFRDKGNLKLFPFDDYSRDRFENFLRENNCLMFLRLHVNSDPDSVKPYLSERVIPCNGDIAGDIMEVLPAFDMLVTDYSSIYIDYLLLKRPVIFLPYDKDEYLKDRGMNFSYEEATFGIYPESLAEFTGEISKYLNDPSYCLEDREAVNKIFNEIDKPCCESICRFVNNLIKDGEYEKSNNLRNL